MIAPNRERDVILNASGARASKSGNHSATAVWRGHSTLCLTMRGESNEAAVLALTDYCRETILGTHPIAPIVVIDTTAVTGLAVNPAFMRACREFLSLLKSKGTTHVMGVSENAAIRSVASAVGFSVGIRLRISTTLGEALALADQEAARLT
jgi:hypothetical protein